MKVSVIIPSYNHSAFVIDAISSVLNQTYKDIELIVIDDGSKDQSPTLLKEFNEKNHFTLVLKENEGVCATLNRGIKIASGDLITFLASDDLMPPTKISEQVEMMSKHPEVDVIAGAITIIDDTNKPVSKRTPKYLGLVTFEQMLERNQVIAPTAMFRKETFQKFGRYNPEYVIEDYYMWLKILSNKGKILNTANIWAYYRVTNTNLEKRFKWYYKGYLQVLREYLPSEKISKSIARYNLIYVTKMVLLQGMKGIKENSDKLNSISFSYRLIIYLIGICPNFIRSRVLNYLLINY